MDDDHIDDEEVVYRRIPPTSRWFESPDRVTSANFKLDRRRGDLELSGYRRNIVTVQQVLKQPGAIPGSRVTQAKVGDIRTLMNGQRQPLQLDVIVVDDENNPGHAEIRGPVPGNLAPAASKALQELFELL